MTTIRYLYIDSVDCKSAAISFQIVKRLNAVNYVKMKLVKAIVDSVMGGSAPPAIGNVVNIELTLNTGTNVVEFIGDITKMTPTGYYYVIEARAETRNLADQRYNGSHSSSSVETLVETIAELDTGLSYSNISGTASGVTLSSFYGYNNDKLTLLKKLSEMSVSGTGNMFVFYQDGATSTTLLWDEFGGTASGMTLAVGADIVQPTEWNETVDELVNDVTVQYSGGVERVTDPTSVGTYGTHAKVIHAYHLNSSGDANYLADKTLYDYKNPRTFVHAHVLHDGLGSGTYDVINTTYALTDATIGKTAAGPYTCIEHKINFPSFIDELTFGSVYQDLTQYQKTLERRIQEIERTRTAVYATDTVQHLHDAEETTSSVTPVLVKTITFNSGLVGIWRCKFQIKTSNTSSDCTVSFKKKPLGESSVAISGLGGTVALTSYIDFSQDNSTIFEPGDALEAYLVSELGGSYVSYLQNLEVCYDFAVVRPVSATMS